MRQDTREADVIVVGAGLAGLTAATRLQRLQAKVVTLEASAEAGGRTRSRALAGRTVDLGGEFVGPHHHRVRELARELGVSLYDSRLSRARTLWRLDDRHRVGYLPPLSASELLAMAGTARALARLARTVPPEEPWNVPDAGTLDAQSFAEWLARRGVRGRARRLLGAMFEGLATTRLERLSALQVLWWIARAGGPLAAMRDVNAMRLSGGAQGLCMKLADRLEEPVRLSTPARRIREEADGVVVESDGEEAWRARQAIVCVPLPALQAIEFIPALDESLRALLSEIGFGKGTSVVVAPRGTPRSRHGVVVGGDSLPVAWRTEGGAKGLFLDAGALEEEDTLVGQLAQAFGFQLPAADADVTRWAEEPFIRGTYVVFEPGQLVRHGPNLRRSHGRVKFASAERSSWPDSMEGAVESGMSAAEGVAVLLRS